MVDNSVLATPSISWAGDTTFSSLQNRWSVLSNLTNWSHLFNGCDPQHTHPSSLFSAYHLKMSFLRKCKDCLAGPEQGLSSLAIRKSNSGQPIAGDEGDGQTLLYRDAITSLIVFDSTIFSAPQFHICLNCLHSAWHICTIFLFQLCFYYTKKYQHLSLYLHR